MSLPPVDTYVSVPYTTAPVIPLHLKSKFTAGFETSNESETEITVTTTVLPTPIGMSYIPSSIATTAILPSSDTTCSITTSATSLSTSFVTSFTTASDPNSTAILSPSSNSTNATASALVSMVTSTSSSSPIPLITPASRASIGLPGTIGLSTALGIFFAAVVALFCFYRRKRKFHKEAMLIAPRLSQHKNHRSVGTGDGTLTGSSSRSGSLEKDVTLEVTNPQTPVRHALPSVGSEAEGFAYNTHMPRTLSPASALLRQQDYLGPALTEQRSPGNNIYAIRYNPGGTLSVEHEAPEGGHPATDQNPPGWDEALERLRTIHESAILRRELSRPPLRITKNTTSSPEDQIQPSAGTLLCSTHPDQESMSELNISDSPRYTDVERRRAAALAKLEGRPNRYTAESIYSRRSDGTPFPRPGDGRGRLQWRGLEKYWPD